MVREVGPASKDIAPGGEKYIGYARTLLGLLKQRLGPVRAGWWRRTLSDGTEIFVTTSYGRDTIQIFPRVGTTQPPEVLELFLESGWGRVSLYYPESAGAVYYTTALLADFNAGVWLDYYEVKPAELWWTERLETGKALTYSPGRASLSFPAKHGRERFFSSADGSYSNHSTCTGLLKKLWQCLCGSKQGFSDLAELIQGPFTVQASYTLFRTYESDAAGGESRLTYYLLRLSASAVYRAKLQFTTTGDALYRTLRLAEAFDEDAEAYLFAQARSVGEWERMGSLEIVGEPIHYGWNQNADGSSAVLVTHERVVLGGGTQYVTARVYVFSAATYSVSIEEEANWTPDLYKMQVWLPNEALMPDNAYHRLWSPLEYGCDDTSLGGWPTDLAYDVPVYAWYADNAVVTVRAFCTGAPGELGTDFHSTSTLSNAWSYANSYVCGVGSGGGEGYHTLSGIAQGFYIDGVEGVEKDEEDNIDAEYVYYRKEVLTTAFDSYYTSSYLYDTILGYYNRSNKCAMSTLQMPNPACSSVLYPYSATHIYGTLHKQRWSSLGPGARSVAHSLILNWHDPASARLVRCTRNGFTQSYDWSLSNVGVLALDPIVGRAGTACESEGDIGGWYPKMIYTSNIAGTASAGTSLDPRDRVTAYDYLIVGSIAVAVYDEEAMSDDLNALGYYSYGLPSVTMCGQESWPYLSRWTRLLMSSQGVYVSRGSFEASEASPEYVGGSGLGDVSADAPVFPALWLGRA